MAAVTSWSVEDVAAWVQECLHMPYGDAFRQASVDGQVLLSLGAEDIGALVGHDPDASVALQRRVSALQKLLKTASGQNGQQSAAPSPAAAPSLGGPILSRNRGSDVQQHSPAASTARTYEETTPPSLGFGNRCEEMVLPCNSTGSPKNGPARTMTPPSEISGSVCSTGVGEPLNSGPGYSVASHGQGYGCNQNGASPSGSGPSPCSLAMEASPSQSSTPSSVAVAAVTVPHPASFSTAAMMAPRGSRRQSVASCGSISSSAADLFQSSSSTGRHSPRTSLTTLASAADLEHLAAFSNRGSRRPRGGKDKVEASAAWRPDSGTGLASARGLSGSRSVPHFAVTARASVPLTARAGSPPALGGGGRARVATGAPSAKVHRTTGTRAASIRKVGPEGTPRNMAYVPRQTLTRGASLGCLESSSASSGSLRPVWSSFGVNTHRGAEFGYSPRDCLSPMRSPASSEIKYSGSVRWADISECGSRLPRERRTSAWLRKYGADSPGPAYDVPASPQTRLLPQSRTPRLGCTTSWIRDLEASMSMNEAIPGPGSYFPQYHVASNFK